MNERYFMLCSVTLTTALVTTIPGCVQTASVDPKHGTIPRESPPTYSDRDYEAALAASVRNGRVNYERLATESDALDRYIGLISVVGPQSTPELFTDQAEAICYYINAFNACALNGVLVQYPTPSVYDLDKPSIQHGYYFKVDGRRTTLGQLRSRLLALSKGDHRLMFALSAAALGSPPLADRPYRPETLNDQLRRNIDAVVRDPNLVRIEHSQREIYVWYRLMNNKDQVLDQLKQVSGRRGDKVVDYLMQWSGDAACARLNSCANYAERRLPFNNTLNDIRSIPTAGPADQQ